MPVSWLPVLRVASKRLDRVGRDVEGERIEGVDRAFEGAVEQAAGLGLVDVGAGRQAEDFHEDRQVFVGGVVGGVAGGVRVDDEASRVPPTRRETVSRETRRKTRRERLRMRASLEKPASAEPAGGILRLVAFADLEIKRVGGGADDVSQR